MLLNLHVQDFVIVEHADLDFGAGFTVFSGETGAGKSILIDALSLALGERADASMVREGAQRADIAASFRTHAALDAWLAQRELEGDPGMIVLRRTVDREGRSRSFINGATATQAQLREAGEFLVDIHGQHAHQQLLRAGTQRAMLDRHAGLHIETESLGQAWRTWQSLRQQLDALERDAQALLVERERVQWQVDELERLAPVAGEWAAITQEHQRLAHAASLIEGTRLAVDTLDEDDSSVQALLGQVLARLRPLGHIDAGLANSIEALDGAHAAVSDAVSSLHSYLNRLELDPQRLETLDLRMQALHGAARKYRCEPEALAGQLAQGRERLAQLENASDAAALRHKVDAARDAYLAQAQALSGARAAAGAQLSREVSRAMQDLAMSGGVFEVALVQRGEPAAHGLEDIEFLVAAHPGVQAKPLSKVASGGELARISLAIAVIAASANATPTLIFDEVDAGIGGAVAEVVGALLRQLGGMRQVLCVTHLAQVAAQADQQWQVNKVSSPESQTANAPGAAVVRTISLVEPLDAAGRVEEIARMLGGIEITAATRKTARELLARRKAQAIAAA